MRRWFRPDLPQRLAVDLDHRQEEIEAGDDVDALWKRARKTRSVQAVAALLAAVTGPRERCMYCEDSRGTDIEHFRPKRLYRDLVFRWPNWLWACTGCNRAKTNRFPLGATGQPLLIDPTAEDPWDHLFYDSATGEIAARWRDGDEDEQGTCTLNVLAPLRNQAVCEGRARTRRGLARAVQLFLHHPDDVAHGPALAELLHAVVDHDDYGLAEWFFLRDGTDEEPFCRLRQERPLAWARVRECLRAGLTGRAGV